MRLRGDFIDEFHQIFSVYNTLSVALCCPYLAHVESALHPDGNSLSERLQVLALSRGFMGLLTLRLASKDLVWNSSRVRYSDCNLELDRNFSDKSHDIIVIQLKSSHLILSSKLSVSFEINFKQRPLIQVSNSRYSWFICGWIFIHSTCSNDDLKWQRHSPQNSFFFLNEHT